MTNDSRNITIDVMKGIAILLVILGHFESVPALQQWISSFHMPLFFLVSGYFHKRPIQVVTIKKNLKRLVLPYLFTMGMLLLYSIIVHCILRVNLHQVGLVFWAVFFPTGTVFANSVPVWFLLALFWCRLTFGVALRMRKTIYATFISLVLGVSFTYLKGLLSFELPLAFMAGMSALTFYSLGFTFHRFQDHFKLIYNYRTPIIIILIGCWITFYRSYSVSMMTCCYDNYPLAVLCGVGGTMAVYYLSLLLHKFNTEKVFVWFGINSLIVLSAHTIERYSPLPYTQLIEITSVWVVFVFKVLLCVVFTLFCYRFGFTRYIYSIKR